MESWFILLSLCLCPVITVFFILLSHSKTKKTKLSLPPGPSRVPIIGNNFSQRMLTDLDSILRELYNKYGPIFTLHIGCRVSIFIRSHSLAHEALIQNGAAFSYRPGPVTITGFIDASYPDCGSSSGALWRLLRKNLTSAILIPSRYKSCGHVRRRAVEKLNELLKYHVESGKSVPVIEHFRYAMFSSLLFMCFGEELDEKVIKDIAAMEMSKLANFERFSAFMFFPTIGKIIFRKAWLELLDMRRKQQSVLLPMVKARRERNKKRQQENQDENVVSYINTLFDLENKDEGGRKLIDEEIVTLIAEVVDAGSDTTSTAFEWLMARVIKDENIQEKLYSEIKGVVSSRKEIGEEDLQKMPYLKAVVLEGLRLHPPTHSVLPHTVDEDIVLNGYLIPKNASVNFMVGEMGRDPKVWKDPMEFKPERFLGDEDVVDITGTKEIKMMPFSAGRRICPGFRLAILHLEFFLANLVRDFKWSTKGHDIDMSERKEFTTGMRTPMRAFVSPRPK